MAGKTQPINTSLSIAECGAVFHDAGNFMLSAGRKVIGAMASARGMANHGFFTPDVNEPCAALQNLPDFSVGVAIPKVSVGASGNVNAVHQYLWDRGTHRHAELYAPLGVAAAASPLSDSRSSFPSRPRIPRLSLGP